MFEALLFGLEPKRAQVHPCGVIPPDHQQHKIMDASLENANRLL